MRTFALYKVQNGRKSQLFQFKNCNL